MNEQEADSATSIIRNAMEKGYKFVLCVEMKDPECGVRQTNASPKKEARMLRKFARLAKESA